MIHLSKLILNPRNPGARRDAAVPYELHRTLLRGFGETAPADNRLLFRVEQVRQETAPGITVLVQSAPHAVDWSFLDSMGDYALHVQQKEVHLNLRPGMLVGFRIAANPTVKRDKKRVPLLREEEQLGWLERKGEEGGFRAVQVHCTPYRTRPRRKVGHPYEKQEIPHFGVRFDGVLQVHDPERLLEGVRSGIGPAKGFGFGLLSLGSVA